MTNYIQLREIQLQTFQDNDTIGTCIISVPQYIDEYLFCETDINYKYIDSFENTINYTKLDFFQNFSKYCVKYSHLDILKYLYEKYNYDLTFEDGVLITLANNNDIINYLLQFGFNLETYKYKIYYGMLMQNIIYDKRLDSGQGDYDTDHNILLLQLLNAGCSIDHNNNKLLRIACNIGNIDVVKMVLKSGVDISKNIDSIFINSTRNNYVEISELLIQHGANVCSNNNEALFKLLNLYNYKNVIDHYKYRHGYTYNDHDDTKNCIWLMYKLLINNGIDINADFCPLYMAATNNYIDIFNDLVKSGANLNQFEEKCKSITNNTNTDMIKCLESHNIDNTIITSVMISNIINKYQ